MYLILSGSVVGLCDKKELQFIAKRSRSIYFRYSILYKLLRSEHMVHLIAITKMKK